MEPGSILTKDNNSVMQLKKKMLNLQKEFSFQQDAFDFISYLISIVQYDGTILYANAAMAQSLGKDKEEIIGNNILTFFPEKTMQHRRNMAYEARRTKKPIEFIDVRQNRFFKSTYFPIIEENGDTNKIIAIVQDITEEKLKEKQLLSNKEAYFESLIENSSDLITVVDKKGKILYESPSLKKILNFSPETRKNKSVFDNVHPADKKRVKEYFSKIISKPGLTEKLTFRIKDKPGKWHYFESIGNNQLQNSKILGLIINSRDISQRVKQQMEKNAILDNTSEIIAYHDKDHRILWANKAYQKETGLSLDQLIGQKCFHAWKLDRPCDRCPLSQALKTGKTVEAVFSPENQKNWPSHYKTWRIIGDPVFNEENEIIGAIELSYDITHQTRVEEEIKRTKDHLEKLIHNTSEIIFSIDHQFKITLWNKTAENLSGLRAKNLIGKDIRKQQFIENYDELITFLRKQLNHESAAFLNQIKLKTLFGSIRLLQVSISLVSDENNNITDIIFICKDVTSEDKVHGNLIRGMSYVIDDVNSDQMLTIFNDLISENQIGLFITRSQYEQIIQSINLDYVTFAVLSDKIVDFAPTIQTLDRLKSYVQAFVKKHTASIICLDRSDYLFTTFGFKQTLSYLYDINDMIRKHQAIFLMRINTELFANNEYEILKEEFSLLPSSQIDHVYLDDSLFTVLNFIYEQNKTSARVYQRNITQQFSISKVTAKKRLDELEDKELIFYKKQGRINQIFITEKGKRLLMKNSSI